MLFASLNGQYFEHSVLSIHLNRSINNELPSKKVGHISVESGNKTKER